MTGMRVWLWRFEIVGLALTGCRSASIEVDAFDCASCAPSCPTACLKETWDSLEEQGWSGPVLLWSGPEAEAPPCPAFAPDVVYEGNSGMEVISSCPSCSCSSPECLLPEGLLVSDQNFCPGNDGPGAVLIPYLVPEGWTGECVAPDIISGELVISLVFLPTRLAGCQPVLGSEPMSSEVRWATSARACRAPEPLAREAIPAGFTHCVHRAGEEETCPPAYPERKVFHGGVEGTISCATCTCGTPEGSDCTAWVSEHWLEPCSGFNGSMQVGFEGRCSVREGSADPLTGVSAEWKVNQPGTCTPQGGEPQGEVIPAEPTTFCCEPPMPR